MQHPLLMTILCASSLVVVRRQQPLERLTRFELWLLGIYALAGMAVCRFLIWLIRR